MDKKLLDEIQKKDSDAKIISQDESGILIETTLDIGEEEEEPETIEFPKIATNIRITRHMFICHALISFGISLYGLVFLQLLLKDYIASLSLLIASLSMSVIFYLLMYFLVNTKWGQPAFIMWTFNAFIVISSLAGTLKSLAPFQGCIIFFIESISIILLGFYYTKEVHVYYAIGLMSLTGIMGWGMGIYAFLEEQDWITSLVLFLLCILVGPLYCGYQINGINNNRYHNKEFDRVLIQFWTDPIGVPIGYIKNRFF
jgi:hypothetical protein